MSIPAWLAASRPSPTGATSAALTLTTKLVREPYRDEEHLGDRSLPLGQIEQGAGILLTDLNDVAAGNMPPHAGSFDYEP